MLVQIFFRFLIGQVFHHVSGDTQARFAEAFFVDFGVAGVLGFPCYALVGKRMFKLMFLHIGHRSVVAVVKRVVGGLFAGGRGCSGMVFVAIFIRTSV